MTRYNKQKWTQGIDLFYFNKESCHLRIINYLLSKKKK